MALQVDITDYKNFVFFGCLLPLLVLLIIGILIAFWYTFMASDHDKVQENDVPVFVSTQFDKSASRKWEVC
ncbi:MAG: hypothetical protein ACYC4Q_12020 [Victivallaceae bacterium]